MQDTDNVCNCLLFLAVLGAVSAILDVPNH